MAGTSRVDRGRSNVYWNYWDISFFTFYTSSLHLHILQYSTDRRQNIIKCCLDHKTSVRARRRLFIIVYKYFIPSAIILLNIKYFSNLPPRISISLKINMSGWWWWCWGAVVTKSDLIIWCPSPPLSSAQGWNPEILCKFYFIVTPRQQLGPHNGAERSWAENWSRYCDQNYFRCQMTARVPKFWHQFFRNATLVLGS